MHGIIRKWVAPRRTMIGRTRNLNEKRIGGVLDFLCRNWSSTFHGSSSNLTFGAFGSFHGRWYSRVTWRDENEPPRMLVVQPRLHPPRTLHSKLLEALRLADSLEDPRHKDGSRTKTRSPYLLVQNPSSSLKASKKRMQAGAYFGAGTIDAVRAQVDAVAAQGQLDAVFVNASLSGVQQRNLEDAWGKPVIDRVGLIIKIFGAHAQTRAAKLQVELASLNYSRTRLVRARGSSGARLGFGAGGESQVVSARGRATGTIGGAGETEIQLQRRRVAARQLRVKRLLAEVDRTHSLHRDARQRQEQIPSTDGQLSRPPTVAVVGYTNAGKSSLVAALSRSNLYVDDKLFATLDTRSRRLVLPSGQKVILSDTVGFISDLPTQLVEAFRSTLDEVVEADILLHVIDGSAHDADEQRNAVLQVLTEIGISRDKLQTNLIEVWNKADMTQEETNSLEDDHQLKIEGRPDHAGDVSGEEDSISGDCSSPNLISIVHKYKRTPREKTDKEILGVEWTRDGVSCVATSALTKVGLEELCKLLDKKLQSAPEKYP